MDLQYAIELAKEYPLLTSAACFQAAWYLFKGYRTFNSFFSGGITKENIRENLTWAMLPIGTDILYLNRKTRRSRPDA